MKDRFPWHLLAWLVVTIAMFAAAVVLMVRDHDCRAVQGHTVGGACVHDGTVSP